MPGVAVPEGYTLVAQGPARLVVTEGRVRVFGAVLTPPTEVTVEPTRALPLYALESSKLEIHSGTFTFIHGDTVPDEWYKLAERVRGEGVKRLLVVGDVDSGKTSLATLFVNSLASGGEKVAVIDADVGQKSIGPPGTVGLGVTEREVYSLSNVPLEDAFFVGSNSPSGVLQRSVAGVSLLARKAERLAKYLVVDTTGWVTDGEGRDLKFLKSLLVEPDLVVLVGPSRALAQLARPLEKLFEVVRVPKPQVLFERGRGDRREYRRHAYSKYMAGATEKKAAIEKVSVAYSVFLSGYSLPSEEKSSLQRILGVEVLYAERSDDHLGVITASQPLPQAVELVKSIYGLRHVRVMSGVELQHSLVAFASRKKYFEGIGIITGIDPRERVIRVLTNVESIEDKLWLLGTQKVNPATFEEEAGIEKWGI